MTRLRREEKILKRVGGGQGVVELLDTFSGPDGGNLFQVFELLPCPEIMLYDEQDPYSLSAAVAEPLFPGTRYQFTFNRVMVHFLHLVGAVRYLHENGVLHKDIKPNNIGATSPFRTEENHVFPEGQRDSQFGMCPPLGSHPPNLKLYDFNS